MSMKKNDAVDTAKAKLSEASGEVAEKIKSTAQGAMVSAKNEAANQADLAKHAAADEMSSVASALRSAADDVRSGSPQERTIGQLANGLADASDAIRDKDLGEVADAALHFARQNPILFLGGAALVGFAAARFVKASQPEAEGGFEDYASNTRDAHGRMMGDYNG